MEYGCRGTAVYTPFFAHDSRHIDAPHGTMCAPRYHTRNMTVPPKQQQLPEYRNLIVPRRYCSPVLLHSVPSRVPDVPVASLLFHMIPYCSLRFSIVQGARAHGPSTKSCPKPL